MKTDILVKEIFTNPENINELFTEYFEEKNYSFRPTEEPLYLEKHADKFEQPVLIGELELDYKLDFFTIKVKENLTEKSSKRQQYEIAKDLLSLRNSDAGIFIFYDKEGNFRLSFVFSEYKGIKRQFSHYKRYTYYVSKDQPNRTFIKQLDSADFSSIQSIKEAFSLKQLTKEFYDEIQNWYAWALKELNEGKAYFPGGKNEENLIRLITRLIFVWFLKEKGLIPEEVFDEEALKDIVKDFKNSNNYYNAILQNLFFATLNRNPEDRKFAKEYNSQENRENFGVKNLYQYSSKLKISNNEFIKLLEKVPFINGGLFECLDDNENKNYIDGFSRNEKKRAKLPDYLFYSDEIDIDLTFFYGSKKKIKVKGLINILKEYNFTADESSPIDVEVSLDPELLGHIFENLLASFNPETQSTARKATGSYYTPKEIVEFMVDEALIEYFKNKTGIEEERLRNLLSYSEDDILSKEEKDKVITAIDQLKILDPAVGSGAFPMGILHKLVHILHKLDPDNNIWKQKQMEKLKELEDEDIENQKEELEKAFENELDYSRKLFLIENSIYGVDIQPIAIQIAKLRFFLSLLIDQKVDKNRKNYGILPLPNLETKFVAANTLISLYKSSQRPIRTPQIELLENRYKELMQKYFSANNRGQKHRIHKEANTVKQKILDELKKNDWGDEVIKKIANFDIFDQLSSADWFDPEWMFGVEDGFDIVIANPPYISTKGIDDRYKKILKEQYGFADDLYNHFYFKGFELLKEKGILTYISSKTFWTIQTKKNLRDLLLENKLLKIVDTANPFESAMVDTGIIVAEKGNYKNKNYEICFIDAKNGFDKKREYKVFSDIYRNVANNVFFIPNEFNMKVYEKFGKKVKKLMDNWWGLISTSKNIKKYEHKLKEYRENLKEGDVTLLGLITEGGQGLATGNNGKYIGVLEGSKYAEKVKKERPEKLWKFIQTKKPEELKFLKSKDEVKEYINSLTEEEIRELFDSLKEKYGRDIFGQGWLYRIVRKWEIADVDSLTEEEKLNGISGNKTFVPYDKGDKEGNRWYAPTPYYINWSRKNVKFLKENSGKKGIGMPVVRNPQFYFREGFCWTDVNSTYLKARIKENGVYDVLTMSLFSQTYLPDWFFVCMINSKFISEYVDSFINSTSHFQINDARQLPIIIPTKDQLKEFEDIFNRAYNIQKNKFEGKITEEEAEKKLEEIQGELDKKVFELYGLA